MPVEWAAGEQATGGDGRGLPKDKEERAPEAGLPRQEAPILFLPEAGPMSPSPGGPSGAWGLPGHGGAGPENS